MKVPKPRARLGNYSLPVLQRSLRLIKEARNLLAYGVSERDILAIVRDGLKKD